MLAGLGVSVLPCLGADSDPRLVRLSDVMAAFDLFIVSSAQSRNNARVRAIKEALIEMLRQGRDELSGEGQTEPSA